MGRVSVFALTLRFCGDKGLIIFRCFSYGLALGGRVPIVGLRVISVKIVCMGVS